MSVLRHVPRQVGHDERPEGAIALLERLRFTVVQPEADVVQGRLHNDDFVPTGRFGFKLMRREVGA